MSSITIKPEALTPEEEKALTDFHPNWKGMSKPELIKALATECYEKDFYMDQASGAIEFITGGSLTKPNTSLSHAINMHEQRQDEVMKGRFDRAGVKRFLCQLVEQNKLNEDDTRLAKFYLAELFDVWL